VVHAILPISARRFIAYGMPIAVLEEFISQGSLQESYFVLWIPFPVLRVLAMAVRAVVFRNATRWLAPAYFYIVSGLIGLAVEWFVIGRATWNDKQAPLALIVVFRAGMFSFWGTVALGPHILLDARPETARIRRASAIALAAIMAGCYVRALTAKAKATGNDVLFPA
jgi:hypothetical protein